LHGAKDNDLFRGLVPDLVDDGFSILQYADDTNLFMENDLEEAKNMKLFLCSFDQLSGLKINFHKSEMFCYDSARELGGSIQKSLDVICVLFLSDTLVFQCIIENSETQIGKKWKKGSKRN
jgi:hypothetical protein